MTWIQTISPEQADGDLAAAYTTIADVRGGVADIHRALSLNPAAMAAHMQQYKTIMFARSPLSRVQRERIGVMVSATNGCAYCAQHHSQALERLRDQPAVRAELEQGAVPAELPEVDQALLAWAQLCTAEPTGAGHDHVERLRAAGMTDRAILDASLVIAYFNGVNRLVLALGVELEEDFVRYCGDTQTLG